MSFLDVLKNAWAGFRAVPTVPTPPLGIVGTIGAVATAVGEGEKLANKGLEMADKKEERNEGAAVQRAATDEATLKVIESVNAPVTRAESDQLWDRNREAFGPGNKPAG